MAYKYEEPLTKKFNEEYRAGRIPNLDLFNELKEVYAKAKAFDRIKIISNKYANDLSTSAEQCIDLIEDELEDRNAI
ncbi:hypothetical protein PYH59_10090 [Mammaliicoccus lentus]|uniref:hypothetical protein n=1 Tax=Mammaliicoccus lentus TaxID=42858 RepID=UPI0024A83E78|nr:hypothetical protein [Mammaliicoccus lentus]WHI54185.1 hypothetical protein PYH59_10090 [Mammaliicoccus lentus]